MKDTNQSKKNKHNQHNFNNENLMSTDSSENSSNNSQIVLAKRNYIHLLFKFFIIIIAIAFIFFIGWNIGSKMAYTKCETNYKQEVKDESDPNEKFKESVFNAQVHLYTVIDQRTEKRIVWLDDDIPIQLFAYEFTYNLEDFFSSPNRLQIIAKVKNPLYQQYYLIDLPGRHATLLELGQNESVVGWLEDGVLLLDKVEDSDSTDAEVHKFYVYQISSADRTKVTDIKEVLTEYLKVESDDAENTEDLVQEEDVNNN